jgi:hypothetical protein
MGRTLLRHALLRRIGCCTQIDEDTYPLLGPSRSRLLQGLTALPSYSPILPSDCRRPALWRKQGLCLSVTASQPRRTAISLSTEERTRSRRPDGFGTVPHAGHASPVDSAITTTRSRGIYPETVKLIDHTLARRRKEQTILRQLDGLR